MVRRGGRERHPSLNTHPGGTNHQVTDKIAVIPAISRPAPAGGARRPPLRASMRGPRTARPHASPAQSPCLSQSARPVSSGHGRYVRGGWRAPPLPDRARMQAVEAPVRLVPAAPGRDRLRRAPAQVPPMRDRCGDQRSPAGSCPGTQPRRAVRALSLALMRHARKVCFRVAACMRGGLEEERGKSGWGCSF